MTTKQMPVQKPHNHHIQGTIPEPVYMRTYEVYCALWGPQKAMVVDGCRGGFSVGEVIALLYARSFPQEEWRRRADEAFDGMELR